LKLIFCRSVIVHVDYKVFIHFLSPVLLPHMLGSLRQVADGSR
jgi:hypothetical protein